LPPLNASAEEEVASEVKCKGCKCLVQLLKLQKTRTLAESPGKKIRRQHPSSQARLQYMSPASQWARKRFAQYQRSSNIRKLARLEENEVVLDNGQYEGMSALSCRSSAVRKTISRGRTAWGWQSNEECLVY